jgi:hypothetical protein
MKTILHSVYFIAGLLFSLSILAQAPPLQWAKQLGAGTGEEQCKSIAVDAAGNVYTTGDFVGSEDFNPGPATYSLVSVGATDIFVSKLDAAGNFVWAKKLGGFDYDYAYGIALDPSGNIYITGRFYSSGDFDPGAGTYSLTSAGQSDIFVCKLDPTGNFIWAKSMGGTSNEQADAITVDASGKVYTSGYYQGTTDFDPGSGTYTIASPGGRDAFISTLDANGNFVSALSFSGASDSQGSSIKVDPAGNIYTCGYFWSICDFDPGAGTYTMSTSGNSDIFVTKLDAAGNLVWARKMGGSNSDYVYSLTLDGSGNVLTTGEFYNTADFDPGPAAYTFTSTGFGDIFVSKLDPSGNFVWAKQMKGIGLSNGDAGKSITTDPSGNVYLTGIFTYTIDFDPGAGTYSLASLGGSDIFVSKLDAAGNFVWVAQMGGTNNEGGNDITLDAAGYVYSTGVFKGTADFDPGASIFNLTNSSGSQYDVYVHKLGSSSSFIGSLTEKNSNVEIFPNPANDVICVSGEFISGASLEIMDLSGRILYKEKLTDSKTTLDISCFNSGVYLLSVFGSSGLSNKSEKLIITR